jgi:hypothetical protein
MKINSSLCILLFSLPFLSNCNYSCTKGDGQIGKRVVSFNNITKLKSEGSFDVTIAEAPDFKVVAEGDQNIVDALYITQENGECSISFKPGCYSNYTLSVKVYMPKTETIELNGSGNMAIENFSSQEKMSLILDGSGDIEVDKMEHLNELKLDIEGSGEIRILSNMEIANTITATINGSGDIKAERLKTKNAKLDINGSGNIEMQVSENANVTISGSGDIWIMGNPKLQKSISGSGDVHIRN